MWRSISLIMSLVVFLGTALRAAEPMSPSEFEAYTQGRTLFFAQNGQAYGAEEYQENRRVIWSFLDGQCRRGFWYPEGDAICFVYEHDPSPQCWLFRRGSSGLIAEFLGDGDQTELYEAQDLGEEMVCLGPEVGV